jgi:hypothetical protein
MPWFSTFYCIGGPTPKRFPTNAELRAMRDRGELLYGMDIWARDRQHARAICHHRGIGERVLWRVGERARFTRASRLLRRKRVDHKAVMHALLNLTHIAAASGALNRDGALADTGLPHAWAHWMQGQRRVELWNGTVRTIRDWARAVERLERITPGYVRA